MCFNTPKASQTLPAATPSEAKRTTTKKGQTVTASNAVVLDPTTGQVTNSTTDTGYTGKVSLGVASKKRAGVPGLNL